VNPVNPVHDQFDVIIIGAGINGAGIARDAAMRGLKVLVVDKGDVGSGTSSWSTRLIHGGLRYLEHFEFGLVRESLRERETLLHIACHLVKRRPFVIPIYKRNQRGPWTIRAGMIAYDLLSIGKSLPWHRMLSRDETLERLPGLNPEGLLGSARYYDAQVYFAERLVLENILAAVECGARVLTYSPVTSLVVENGVVAGVEFVTEEGTQFAHARVVINAAGPWVDRLLERAPVESPKLIGGTKGSHIVVPKFPGAPKNAVYLEAQRDQRPFFVIPWVRKYLIGTTDVRFEDDPDQARCELWEVDYLLNETNLAFPQARLTRNDIFYTYSGVRPLPRTSETAAEDITRRHFIREHPKLKNLLSIVGGKLTTYRSLAEECVDLVFRKLGKKSPECETATNLLPGMMIHFDSPSDLATLAISNKRFERMVYRWGRTYGFRAEAIAQLALQNPALGEPLGQSSNVLKAEIVFAFNNEMAKTLVDCLLRRTMIGLKGDLGLHYIHAAADVCVRFLGWTDARAKQEVENYRAEVSKLIVYPEADV
jgi:glycerol-3-phosphate dehydrogenase